MIYLEWIVLPVELAGALTRVVINTLRVVHEIVIDFEGDGQRSILDERELHQLLVAGSVVSTDVTVLGHVGASAFLLIILRRPGRARSILADVGVAFLWKGAMVLGVLAGNQIRETSFAALAVGRAADNVLWR